MLNFIYYPVSAILWFWHEAFGFLFGAASGVAWTLAVMFLVFSLRALLYKPFVHQIRSMRKMQQFAPEIQKLKKRYGNDKQKLAAEMQKLQGEHGVNPLGGCLPILVQVPVFIGLFHVLREFKPGKTENYVFGAEDVASFNEASLFGAKLGASVYPFQGGPDLAAYGTTLGEMLTVMIPLMIVAGVLTHITARHSVARQSEVQAANPQAAMMNKLMLYVFPIGVVIGAPFLPLAILLYWVANNLWTLGQQQVVYTKLDKEEADQKVKKAATRQSLAPRPGQKPESSASQKTQKKPGAKPIASGPKAAGGSRNDAASGGSTGGSAASNGAESVNGDDADEGADGVARAPDAATAKPIGGPPANGSAGSRGAAGVNGAGNGARKSSDKRRSPSGPATSKRGRKRS